MKVAMWGVGLLVLGAFGFFLINLFGNITVTNQLNYTTLRNSIEAAMLDSVDIASYRSGFCFCTSNTSGVFTNTNEYKIEDLHLNDKNEYVCNEGCQYLSGEYKINANDFKANFTDRFNRMVNNNKKYQITFGEIIEYPPKVTVRVDSTDDLAFNEGEFTIVNKLDGLLEEKEKK